MDKIFAIIVGLMLFSLGAEAAEETCLHGLRCKLVETQKHPQDRVLKPEECMPIRFVRVDNPGVVAIGITYRDGTTFRVSHPVTGDHGEVCYGPKHLKNAARIDVCDEVGSAWIDMSNPEHATNFAGLGRGAILARGISLCLKGVAWCSRHGLEMRN